MGTYGTLIISMRVEVTRGTLQAAAARSKSVILDREPCERGEAEGRFERFMRGNKHLADVVEARFVVNEMIFGDKFRAKLASI